MLIMSHLWMLTKQMSPQTYLKIVLFSLSPIVYKIKCALFLYILMSSGTTLTAAASVSSAVSVPWACPGSWCQSWRWATPGCQWLKSTPASRPEYSNCSSGKPCLRNTSPKPRSGYKWNQTNTNHEVKGGMWNFLLYLPVWKCNFYFKSMLDISCMTYWLGKKFVCLQI